MNASPARARRRGFGMALALLAVMLVGMVAASMLRRQAGARRVLRGEERWLQAEWLAESGLERAAARLAIEPSYQGEPWSIGPEELGGRDGAMVQIRVEPVAGRAGLRRVRVQADYPTDAPRRVRRSKTVEIPVEPGPPEGLKE